jgi:hypothetical protein
MATFLLVAYDVRAQTLLGDSARNPPYDAQDKARAVDWQGCSEASTPARSQFLLMGALGQIMASRNHRGGSTRGLLSHRIEGPRSGGRSSDSVAHNPVDCIAGHVARVN